MLFLLAIGLGLVFGLLTGGRLTNLLAIKFRWPWLVLAAVVVRDAALLTPLNGVAGVQYAYLVGLVAIVAWTVWHWRRLRGIWIVTLGATLNLVVIAANGARMPVAPEFAGSLVSRGSVGQYTLMGPGTNLNLLGDWIRLYPAPGAYSIGDVLIALGLAIVLFLAVRNPSPYKELTPP
ncbi:MAG: hypothetical protein E6I72_09360 [Chloroflexi bacterium]|nr:MAG: hypothetical protein E6I72_09360 [Chloroflexota bacterium]